MAFFRNQKISPSEVDRRQHCIHENVDHVVCPWALEHQIYRHILSPHQNCRQGCPGCNVKVPRVVWKKWYGEVPQFPGHREIDYDSIFTHDRISYRCISEEDKEKYHEEALQLLHVVYGTADVTDTLADLQLYLSKRSQQHQAPQYLPTAAQILGFCTSLKLAANKTRVVLDFVRTDVTATAVAKEKSQILARHAITKPQTPNGVYKQALNEVLASLIEQKVQLEMDGTIAQDDNLLVKVAVDAGSVFRGPGTSAQMTLVSLENPSRGEHRFKSSRSTFLLGAHSGKESRKLMEEELSELWSFIDHPTPVKVTHMSRQWTITFVLTNDLPASAELLGWSHFWCPNSKECKCIFCGKDAHTIRALPSSLTTFPLRPWSEIVHDGDLAHAGHHIPGHKVNF